MARTGLPSGQREALIDTLMKEGRFNEHEEERENYQQEVERTVMTLDSRETAPVTLHPVTPENISTIVSKIKKMKG